MSTEALRCGDEIAIAADSFLTHADAIPVGRIVGTVQSFFRVEATLTCWKVNLQDLLKPWRLRIALPSPARRALKCLHHIQNAAHFRK